MQGFHYRIEGDIVYGDMLFVTIRQITQFAQVTLVEGGGCLPKRVIFSIFFLVVCKKGKRTTRKGRINNYFNIQ